MQNLARLFSALVFVTTLVLPTQAEESANSPALQVFEQRILPIFRAEKPSSCVQCHLSSVDLKEYILPSHEKTFLALRDQGLIDLDQPEKSKILTLIGMGEKDLDEGARLIHAKTRQAEYEAFAAWIKECCSDEALCALPRQSSSDRAGPEVADEVIRHTRKSRVVDSFVRNVWSQRMRCFPCHTPFEVDSDDPKHAAVIKKQKEFAANFPELVPKLNLFLETPEATLQSLIEKSKKTPEGQLPILNLEEPTQSLLVLKPMSKLPGKTEDGKLAPPSSSNPVSHMGGLKMHPNDQSYKAFVAWIADYARVVDGEYASVAELPADNWHPTQLVLKLSFAPEKWPVGTPVQLVLYQPGHSDPIAFTQGTVTPRKMVNGAMFLFKEPSGDNLVAKGNYSVKVYADLNGRIAKDPAVMLGEADYAGQIELKVTSWREGFRFGKTVSGKELNQ